jgi:hypothetical protein
MAVFESVSSLMLVGSNFNENLIRLYVSSRKVYFHSLYICLDSRDDCSYYGQ